jgi:hypothetical protein
VERDLRCTNFVLGTNEGDFETDYRAAFKGAAPPVEISTKERMRSKEVMAGSCRWGLYVMRRRRRSCCRDSKHAFQPGRGSD